MTKVQLVKHLIEEYGVDKEEIKSMNFKQLQDRVKAEESHTLNAIESTVPKKSADVPTSSTPISNLIQKPEMHQNILVPIMSCAYGTVSYTSKRTGREWKWTNYGQMDNMELSELVAMRNAHRRYLEEPWLMILEESVVEYLGLSKVYENCIKPDEIDAYFKLGIDKMREILEKAPNGMKQLIIATATEKIASGTFDSRKKIKMIEEVSGIKLEDEE